MTYTAWEHVSPDKKEALVCIVAVSVQASLPCFTLRLKRLDPALSYTVNNSTHSYGGDILMNAGYPLTFPPGDYQSVQLLLKAVQEEIVSR